jgi:hypothetical protein
LQSKPLSLYLGYINSWREKMIDEKTNLYIDETRDYLLESVSHLLRLYLRSAGLQIDNPKVISTQMELDKDKVVALLENITKIEQSRLGTH